MKTLQLILIKIEKASFALVAQNGRQQSKHTQIHPPAAGGWHTQERTCSSSYISKDFSAGLRRCLMLAPGWEGLKGAWAP